MPLMLLQRYQSRGACLADANRRSVMEFGGAGVLRFNYQTDAVNGVFRSDPIITAGIGRFGIRINAGAGGSGFLYMRVLDPVTLVPIADAINEEFWLSIASYFGTITTLFYGPQTIENHVFLTPLMAHGLLIQSDLPSESGTLTLWANSVSAGDEKT